MLNKRQAAHSTTELQINHKNEPGADARELKAWLRNLAAKLEQAGNFFELNVRDDERWAQSVVAGNGQSLKMRKGKAEMMRIAKEMLRLISIARADIQRGDAANAARWAQRIGYLSAHADVMLEQSKNQSDKGKAGTEKRWNKTEADQALKEIYSRLAKRRDELGDYEIPSELWPRFFAELQDAELSPVDGEEYHNKEFYELRFGKKPYQKILFGSFSRRIRRLQNTL